MNFADMAEYLELRVDYGTFAACVYLESQGLQFMIDFGLSNAFEMAFHVLEYGTSEAVALHWNEPIDHYYRQ